MSCFKFLLFANLGFLAFYTAMLIYAGVARDGEMRAGLLAGFGAAQGYAVLFSLFLLLSYCTPLSSSNPCFGCIFFTIIISCVLFLIGNVAAIIAGSLNHGYVRIVLVVAGSVSLVHYFGFILLILALMGMSAARG